MQVRVISSARMRLFIALLASLPMVDAAAIDFNAHYATSVQDGFPVTRLYFFNEAQRVYLSIPRSWHVVGEKERATFTPANVGQCEVIMENSTVDATIPFDEKGLETYRKAAANLIPEGSEEVQIDFERTNELQINGWTSFEMAFTYLSHGQRFSNSVLFIGVGKEKQIHLRVLARKEDFTKLYAQARTALGSWFAPSPELEAALAHLSKQ